MRAKLTTLLSLFIPTLIFAHSKVARYEFNGNTFDNRRGIHAINNGATFTADRHDRKNRAIEFDGIDDFLEIKPGVFKVRKNGSFTMETYAKLEPTDGTFDAGDGQILNYRGGAIFSAYGCGIEGTNQVSDLFILWHDNFNLILNYRENSGNLTQENLRYRIDSTFFNEYHHLAVVLNGKKNTLSLYVDGEKVKSIQLSETGKLDNFKTFIGKHNPCISNNGESAESAIRFLKGKLDYFRIFPRAFSDRKVKRRYRIASRKPRVYVRPNNTQQPSGNGHECSYYELMAKLKVYPNPGNGYFNISAHAKMNCSKIIVFNSCGRAIRVINYKRQINLSDFRPGFYYLHFVVGNKVLRKRIIISR